VFPHEISLKRRARCGTGGVAATSPAPPGLTAALFDLGVLFLKADGDGLSPPEGAAAAPAAV